MTIPARCKNCVRIKEYIDREVIELDSTALLLQLLGRSDNTTSKEILEEYHAIIAEIKALGTIHIP